MKQNSTGYWGLAFKDGKDVRLLILAPPFAFFEVVQTANDGFPGT